MRGPKWENPRAKFYFPKELNERKRRAHYGHDRFTYNFTSLLEVARFMRAYLLWDNARPKTPFTKLSLQMAGSLLGKVLVFDQKSHKPAWQLNRADLTRLANRLTSAGINPQTFQIQDQIRARWAWHQLSDYPYFYSEYRQAILQQLEATGLRVNRGGRLRSFKYADYGFRRHAFKPPVYKFKAQLRCLRVELGDVVSFTHGLVLDFQTGKFGVVNATCEVIDRRPDYSTGAIDFTLLDLRFCNISTAYQIAPLAAGAPVWGSASTQQKQQYMFVSELSLGGENPDGTPGNTIF